MAATYQPSQWLIPKNENTDKVGNYSFEFDGSADYVDIINSEIPPAIFQNIGDNNSYTISAWIKTTGGTATDPVVWASDETIFELREESNAADTKVPFSFGVDNNKICVGRTADYVTNGQKVYSTTSVNDGDWHHVVVVIVDDAYTFYLDSEADGSGSFSTATGDCSVGAQTSNMQIGVRTRDTGVRNSNFFNGNISEVSLFNYALSSDQVTTLYGSAGAGVGNPMALDVVPVAYYKGDRAALGDQWAVANQVSQDYVFYFDGSSYIDLTTPYALGVTSVSFWMNSSDTTNGGVTLGLGNLTFVGTTPLLRLGSANYKYFADQSANFDGNWHHWFFLITGALDDDILDAKMFVDGVEIAGGSTANHGSPSAWTVSEIGSSPWGGQKVAKITEFAIWQSDQTVNISTIYNNGTPGDLTSLSPTGWWQLNSSATFSTNWNIPDASSGSNTGTSAAMTQASLVPSTVTRGTAMYSNYSFDFDGVDDKITIGNPANLQITGALSLSCWVNFTLGTQTIILTKDQQGGSNRVCSLWVDKHSGTPDWPVVFGIFSGGSSYNVEGTSDIKDGNWHHVVATFEPSTALKVYIDGVLEGTNTTSIPATIDNDPADWCIGAFYNTTSFNYKGKACDVAIFDSTLSAANVASIYNNGRPGDLTSFSPVSWWKLGQNASFDGSNWTTPDLINSNDGTSSGMGASALVGDAPQSFANGLSVSMDIDSRIGESGFSDENSLSYNMGYGARSTSVPG